MDKYLIAIDMDGTLLNSKNEVTERSIEILQKLAGQGHFVVPASGRAITLLPKALDVIENRTYAITENGAVIWNYTDKTADFCVRMPKGTAVHILQDVGVYPCYAEVFCDGTAYMEAADVDAIRACGLGKEFIDYMLQDHIRVEGLAEETTLLNKAEKINIYFERPDDAKQFRAGWEQDTSLAVTTSISGNVEFNRRGVNKGNALKTLREKLGIEQNRVIAFGDNENDLDMFAEAGTAVAMANAKEEIRAAADCVTEDHDHDGVACFLEKFFK